jgi:proteasome component ECM29
MGQILTAIVPERQKALNEHFGAVMRDLLSEMGSRLWRNRQSACLAAADLLQVRSCRLHA